MLSLADKPRLEELYQFLEFQLPRQWAPVFSDLPLGPQRKPQSSSSLPFNFIGPKLYVNTSMILKLEKDTDDSFNLETVNRRYYVPIQWKHLSHVCTAPVESDDEQSIVTGA